MERDFIGSLLLPLADTAAARGLADDAAVWTPPLGRDLVFTHDVLAAGIHYLVDDPPGDIAWKLLAVNLSDLAAMGAMPMGVLMGLGLSVAETADWRAAFADGLGRALRHFKVPLWGGDTVAGLPSAVLGLTAIGSVEPGSALGRSGAMPGDAVWVSGSIGDAGLGLAIAKAAIAQPNQGDKWLLNRFRRPQPRLALGRALIGIATAAMDISDGLLIDADRLAAASGVGITIGLATMPLSAAALAKGDDIGARLAAATAGDDYELLFTAPAGAADQVRSAAEAARIAVTLVGSVDTAAGVRALDADGHDVTPARLGWEY